MVIIFDEYQRYYYISVRPLLNHLKAKFMNEWMNEWTNIFIRIIKWIRCFKTRPVFNTDNKHDFFVYRNQIDFQ